MYLTPVKAHHSQVLRNSIKMPLKRTIASKIFGLAVFLLMLTVGLAVYLLIETTATARSMSLVAKEYLPIADSITRIHEYGLRRRLAFERWNGALKGSRHNMEVVSEASANYTLFTARLNQEFDDARQLLDAGILSKDNPAVMADLRTLLTQVEAAYPALGQRQMQILDLRRKGEHARATELLNVLNDQQRALQGQREAASSKVDAMTQAAADDVARRQIRLVWLTIAATLSTVLLGLAIAAIITGRLTRPVRSLMAGMRDVQGGNLDLQLPVISGDELGSLTNSFNYFVRELRSKEQIKRTFGKYIDPRVLEQVLQLPDAAHIAGERRVMTVMFADIVGFSGLSERLTPSRMVALLNRHFGLQANAVQEHRGVIDKFIGDAVMAFWGPPFVTAEEHAALACRAALAQRVAIETLRHEMPEISGLRKDTPEIDLRLGICSGELVVGNVGGENTRSYTVIGDTVNLASRIEGANRIYDTNILLSESTARAVGDEFELREIDSIAVKGKTEAVRVFELLGAAGGVPAEQLQLRERYQQALTAYRAQDWSLGEQLFNECARSGDQSSLVMLARIGKLRASPPGESWDGTWRLDEK